MQTARTRIADEQRRIGGELTLDVEVILINVIAFNVVVEVPPGSVYGIRYMSGR